MWFTLPSTTTSWKQRARGSAIQGYLYEYLNVHLATQRFSKQFFFQPWKNRLVLASNVQSPINASKPVVEFVFVVLVSWIKRLERKKINISSEVMIKKKNIAIFRIVFKFFIFFFGNVATKRRKSTPSFAAWPRRGWIWTLFRNVPLHF